MTYLGIRLNNKITFIMKKKELTISEFRAIIREETIKLKKRIVLENEKKALKEELKNLLEAKFDLETTEVEKFLDKVKLENPKELARFRSIIKNKGLKSAKKRYKEIDPKVILQKKKELSKEKAKATRKKLRLYESYRFARGVTNPQPYTHRAQRVQIMI